MPIFENALLLLSFYNLFLALILLSFDTVTASSMFCGLLRGGGNENVDPESLPTAVDATPETPKPPSRSLKAQITEKEIIIAQLEARVSALEAEVLQLRQARDVAAESLSLKNKNLLDRNQVLSLTNKSLNSLKRKAETTLSEELTKRHKRIKRLENEWSARQEETAALISGLEDDLDAEIRLLHTLERNLVTARAELDFRDLTILSPTIFPGRWGGGP
ncbi:hypothetical protein B0H10DRAFT_1962585 [Mycena sp. CBHHK59/15]|nr:hypothetical protein B0H10DRAFT_1962585 [Mycena sp. CBHHK59/15]